MAKSKKSGSQVTQGGINIKGNATINSRNVAGRDNVAKSVKNTTNINVSFAPVYHALNKNTTIAPKTKKVVEQTVKEIEKEAGKGETAKVSFIQKRLENIEKMAPDIADVVIATLQNPLAGISVALRKVLAKMQSARAK
jgi:hypothetical protein